MYTGQNPRQHVVLIEIQPNAYNNYLSETAGVILTILWFGFFSVDLEFMNTEAVFFLGGGGEKNKSTKMYHPQERS